MKKSNIEKVLQEKVDEIINDYKSFEQEELVKAEIATKIAIEYLKMHRDIHRAEGFGVGLEDEDESKD